MNTKLGSPGGPTPSAFCLGTINWGTKTVGDDLDHLYDAFREAGGNFFDSAHVYACWLPSGHGASERALGEVVRRRGDRDCVLLATKGGHPTIKDHYPRPDAYLSPESIATDVRDSLDRLGVESIDLYYLHRDDLRVPVGEIVDALDPHVRSGRLKQLGVSNWTTPRIAAALDYAAANGRAAFVADQPKFSLAVAKPSSDPTVPLFDAAAHAWHAAHGLTVCPYSPTANGYFATGGKKGAGGWQPEASSARLRAAEALAEKLGVTANQIAMAWLRHQPFAVIPILGTTNVDHLRDAFAAASITLTPDQVNALSAGA